MIQKLGRIDAVPIAIDQIITGLRPTRSDQMPAANADTMPAAPMTIVAPKATPDDMASVVRARSS